MCRAEELLRGARQCISCSNYLWLFIRAFYPDDYPLLLSSFAPKVVDKLIFASCFAYEQKINLAFLRLTYRTLLDKDTIRKMVSEIEQLLLKQASIFSDLCSSIIQQCFCHRSSLTDLNGFSSSPFRVLLSLLHPQSTLTDISFSVLQISGPDRAQG